MVNFPDLFSTRKLRTKQHNNIKYHHKNNVQLQCA